MRLFPAVAAVLLLAAGPALAQTGGSTGGGQPAQPPGSTSDRNAPAVPVPPQSGTSEQLSRSGGVVRPLADPDPGMARPAPEPGTNSMPIITPRAAPPGTRPPGASEVQPK